MDRFKIEVLNIATGGLFQQAVEGIYEVTTAWYTGGQELRELAFSTSSLFSSLLDEQPGGFTTQDMALGNREYAYSPDFKGDAIIGTDPSIIKPNKDIIDSIKATMADTVNEGGKLRFNLRGIDLDAVYDPKNNFYGSYPSQELRYIYSHPNVRENTVFYIYRDGNYEQVPTPILSHPGY